MVRRDDARRVRRSRRHRRRSKRAVAEAGRSALLARLGWHAPAFTTLPELVRTASNVVTVWKAWSVSSRPWRRSFAERPLAGCPQAGISRDRSGREPGARRSRGCTSDGNTFSFAATPRSVNNLLHFPPSGIYIWVSLNRPARRVTGRPLRVPLRLPDATVLEQEGAPRLPEYRFQGRYGHQYEAMIGVDFGRAHPSGMERRLAQRALNALVWPRWTTHYR